MSCLSPILPSAPSVLHFGSWISMDLDPVHDHSVEVPQVEELEVDEKTEGLGKSGFRQR